SEQRHVPRRARRDHRTMASCRVVQTEGADVFDGAIKGSAEVPVRGAQLRHCADPSVVADTRVRNTRVVVPTLDPRVAEGDEQIELDVAHRVPLDADVPDEPARRCLHRRPLDPQLGLAMHVAEAPPEEEDALTDLAGMFTLAARTG